MGAIVPPCPQHLWETLTHGVSPHLKMKPFIRKSPWETVGGGDWPAIPYVGPFFFSKVLPKFEFKVNFSIESCASLTREDPAYLQIPYPGC